MNARRPRWIAVLAAVAAFAAAGAGARAANGPTAFPVHGTALAPAGPGAVVAAIDAVPGMYGAQTRRYRTGATLRPGETFDAYLDPRAARLDDVHQAAAFVPGLPNHLITHVIARGDTLPAYRFESQTGRFVRFSDFRGKVVLLSFIYTRCPDLEICPAISGKFAYMQHHLDPRHFQLVEVTLDPLHDSPVILRAYGEQYAVDPHRWSLLTGEPAQIKNLIDEFGLSPLETHPGRIIHGDELAILNPEGKIADLVPTAGWAPADAIATAENIAGLSSNPLRRFELATIAGVIAFCGGSVSTATVVLDSSVFVLGVAILGGFLIWITKRVIIDERY